MPRDTAPATRERLWPGPWAWVIGFGIAAMLGIAYGAALGSLAGLLVGLIGVALTVLLALRAAVVVEVGPDGLRVGRALLPWSCVGRVAALDGPAARSARGPRGDPTAHLVLRPGVGPGALLVEVTDPEDPHRTWLVASRNPSRLTRAIAAARGRLTP